MKPNSAHLRKLFDTLEKKLTARPNQQTLDHLAMMAGFQSWSSFLQALHGEADAQTNYNGQTD